MESFRRDLFVDMTVDRFIFNIDKITLSPCFTFILKRGVGLPKTRIFNCVHEKHGPSSNKLAEVCGDQVTLLPCGKLNL